MVTGLVIVSFSHTSIRLRWELGTESCIRMY